MDIAEAKADLNKGENYVNEVEADFSGPYINQLTGDAEVKISGDINSRWSGTRKTQEELLQEVIEWLEGYEAYTDAVSATIRICDDKGEIVECISQDGTKEEIIEAIKSEYGLQEGSVQGNIQSENEGETETIAFSANDVTEVVARQKATRLQRAWNVLKNWVHGKLDKGYGER